ncbi:MAG TPA: YraN family protein [Bacteroidales bacterium]|nr:YraN family protein [Bacteroidales bacterium]
MAEFHDTGKKGERLAIEHLVKNGYAILETNWQSGHKEIDIIAKKGEVVVFVEVKARKTAFFGEPEEFVSKFKQKLLIQAANNYLSQKKLSHEVRFDIISILFMGSQLQVNHIEEAFYPTL